MREMRPNEGSLRRIESKGGIEESLDEKSTLAQ